MFSIEDVAVDHYVDWDWRVVLAVIVLGLVSAGFSCWISSGQRCNSAVLSIIAYTVPPYVAVACVWLGASRLESGRLAFWVYLLLFMLLSIAVGRSCLAVGLWGVRSCILWLALMLAVWAASWETLRRLATAIPTTVPGLVFLIVGFVLVAVFRGNQR